MTDKQIHRKIQLIAWKYEEYGISWDDPISEQNYDTEEDFWIELSFAVFSDSVIIWYPSRLPAKYDMHNKSTVYKHGENYNHHHMSWKSALSAILYYVYLIRCQELRLDLDEAQAMYCNIRQAMKNKIPDMDDGEFAMMYDLALQGDSRVLNKKAKA